MAPSSSLLPLLLLSLLSAAAMAQDAPCPLNFTVLQKFVDAFNSSQSASSNASTTSSRCRYIVQGIHLVQGEYLRTAGLFLPPVNASASCWSALQPLVDEAFPGFDPRSACGFRTEWISTGCMNISSLSQFQALATNSSSTVLSDVASSCNRSLAGSTCATCTSTLPRLNAFLTGPENGNVSDCASYPFIYAGGVVNQFGPTNDDTAVCLFILNFPTDSGAPSSSSSGGGGPAGWVFGVMAGVILLLVLAVVGAWALMRRRRQRRRRRKKRIAGAETVRGVLELESVGASTTLVSYTYEEIKSATGNFSRENIIGKGGYGNVYKGVLADGSEVALKRFKNCSAAGDEGFRHEVEVIASVRHVNLVGLRGYCIATTKVEGHQRIIVCDLMRNGSLHDHLFGWAAVAAGRKLSWPIRQKIAVGTARGLAYLHYSVQPSIIHRDIKASNILLDEDFEPKVADFGLAKFAPEGVSHVSTRVAGTLGYVAPEYALYGQLTERSDVYSFGVVLLELLSGKKAIMSMEGDQPSLLTDWSWSLVRRGRALDIIEEGMDELGPNDVMEKYVMVAVLASHPQLHARPMMDQIVKILETSDMAVPTIPDRPIPLTSNMSDIERSVSSSGSGQLSSFSGYQSFALRTDDVGSE